jgi:O-succinylbenzoate synthase
MAASDIGACKIVNIKPVRVGGILTSIKLHDYAAEHNIGVWCGGMLETGIGRAFNIALASKSNFIYPADMSPYQFYFSEDLIDPSFIVNQNGYIDVPNSPGLGYNIRDDLIQKFTTDKVMVEN